MKNSRMARSRGKNSKRPRKNPRTNRSSRGQRLRREKERLQKLEAATREETAESSPAPRVEIKQEPEDDFPCSSTSNPNANTDNPWAISNLMVESQRNLPNISSANGLETSDGGHLRTNREAYSSTIPEAVAEEVRQNDTSFESSVNIKQEPVDYYPYSSTSIDTSNKEFILQPKDSSLLMANPAVESQFILSVANLTSLNEPATFDGEKLTNKRKDNSSMIRLLVPSSNIAEIRQHSPIENSGGFSNSAGSSRVRQKDHFDAFGEYIADKLRSLDLTSSSYAQKVIKNVILEAQMGKYRNQI